MEEETNLIEIFNLLRNRIVLIFNISFMGLLIAAAYTFFIATPNYSAETQLLVNRNQETEVIQRSDIETNVQLINTYSDIIRNPVILDSVIEDLNLNTTSENLKNQINVTTENNSQVFTVQVSDINPYNAAEIANSTANVFKNELNSIMNVDNVTVISSAIPDIRQVSPNNTLSMGMGLVLGGMLGVFIAFIIEFLDTTVKDDKFITNELGWSNLGYISMMSNDELKSDNQVLASQKFGESRKTRSRV